MPAVRQPLRKWQERAFEAWRDAGRRGIVAVVTGGGKTALALHCLDAYRTSVPAATSLIVVPTNALLEQWLEEVTTYFDIPLSHIAILNARSRIRRSRINLCVINTAAQLQHSPRDEPLFLIVDECHRAASEVFRRIFAFSTDASLGLSATPERQYDDGLQEVLIPGLGPVILTYTYREALADGVIVPFTLKNVLFDFEPHEQDHTTNLQGRSESPLNDSARIRRRRCASCSSAREYPT